nr:uncharacterized protein LOC112022822 [Quercus suber]
MSFELIKEYLLHLPILVPPQQGKPLLPYLFIIRDAVGSMLAQEDDDKNERVVYYLSKIFHDYETRYTPIEKSCFALVLTMQKLRHIILPFQIWVVARMGPLKYLFEKTALSGRLSRWLILLAEFDLKYKARKTIKGSVVSDFHAENPIEGEDGKEDFLDEDFLDIKLGAWKMYFDGVVNQYGNGIGVPLITPDGSHVPLAIKLNFEATNNMAKYEASIAKMEALRELLIKKAEVFRDSTLVVAQAQKLRKGIDVIGRIAHKASNGYEYIVVAINYFTKWVEGTSYFMLKAKHLAQFIENNIICRYGVPQEIISNNGSQFEWEVRKIMELYNIKHHKSSPY